MISSLNLTKSKFFIEMHTDGRTVSLDFPCLDRTWVREHVVLSIYPRQGEHGEYALAFVRRGNAWDYICGTQDIPTSRKAMQQAWAEQVAAYGSRLGMFLGKEQSDYFVELVWRGIQAVMAHL